MQPTADSLQEAIAQQREALRLMLIGPLQKAAELASYAWHDRTALDAALTEAFRLIPGCKYLYALNTDGVQVSSNVSRDGLIPGEYGRDRSQRPYMREVVPADGFVLSQAYISLRAQRPSLTAIQLVRGTDWRVLGFVGADFDLRDLPITRRLYEEPRTWRQIKGDPAIRGLVFHQTRVESEMDRNIDTVLSVVEELMTQRGVYHVMLHFSSSRAVVWVVDDPYRYRLLDIHALIDPDVCLAYPLRPYPLDALVRAEQIRPVLRGLRELRFMDEMLYLRTGTLNIFNGVVGLTFSCDGSHYVPVDQFLDKGHDFWASGLAVE
ncbi:MAG: PDC sensor domain-containing protein [Thiobacillaceae bacterium]|nr:PDC sensor domain-containing protein [Thiobacillaceae bacterium]